MNYTKRVDEFQMRDVMHFPRKFVVEYVDAMSIKEMIA